MSTRFSDAMLQLLPQVKTADQPDISSPSFDIVSLQPGVGSNSAALLLPLSQIVVSNRIRQYLDAEKTESLAQSIHQYGFRGVLWVRVVDGQYHLIAGGRRYAACQLAGVREVPVEVWDVTDAEALQLELLENFQREDLNPIEETEGVLRMLEVALGLERSQVITVLGQMARRKDGDENNVVLTDSNDREALFQQVDELFGLIGKYSATSFRSHRLPLLNLPPSLIEAISSGKLEYTKARAIARVKDDAVREQVLEQALTEDLSHTEITEIIKLETESAAIAPPPERVVYSRVQRLAKRFRSAKLGSAKLKKAEKLLAQLEELLGERD